MKLNQWNKIKATVTTLTATTLLTSPILLSSPPALATNRFFDEIVLQLARAAVFLGYEGNQMTHNPKVDTLRNQGKHMISLNLRSGVSYGLIYFGFNSPPLGALVFDSCEPEYPAACGGVSLCVPDMCTR